MKKLRVSQFITAIKKDEIPWIKGKWFQRDMQVHPDPSQIVGACVLGVGCINLGIGTLFYADNEGHQDISDALGVAISDIQIYNDNFYGGAQTWEEARDYAVQRLTPFKNKIVYAEETEYNVYKS